MPRFVPVTDPEVPRSEQNLHSYDLIKHRKWDNPHGLVDYKVKRTNYKAAPKGGENRYRNLANRDKFDYVTPKRKRHAYNRDENRRDTGIKEKRMDHGTKHTEYKSTNVDKADAKKVVDEERKLMESMGLPSKFS